MTKLFDELPEIEDLDIDALAILDDFQQGTLDYDELKSLVGPEAANTIQRHVFGSQNPDSLFDDPEDF